MANRRGATRPLSTSLAQSTKRIITEKRLQKHAGRSIVKPARKMKPGRGAAKGAAFERLIAKQFSLWVSGGKNPDLLWRSAGSGGRSTMRRKQTGRGIEYHASDIAPLHPDAAPFVDVFTLECKNYAALDLHRLFYEPGQSSIVKWWRQAWRDARSVGRKPLLVMRELRQAALIVVPSTGTTPDIAFVQLAGGSAVWVEDMRAHVILLDAVLRIPYVTFKNCHSNDIPSLADNGPTPDRKRTRLV